MTDLSFARFVEVSVARAKRWHSGFPDCGGWSGADWSNALVGEAGEAANVVKKLRRRELGLAGGEDATDRLADEIGDVLEYAVLLAAYYGIDPAEAAISKFNRVSERHGFPERL